jgi:hypothetical protein
VLRAGVSELVAPVQLSQCSLHFAFAKAETAQAGADLGLHFAALVP